MFLVLLKILVASLKSHTANNVFDTKKYTIIIKTILYGNIYSFPIHNSIKLSIKAYNIKLIIPNIVNPIKFITLNVIYCLSIDVDTIKFPILA